MQPLLTIDLAKIEHNTRTIVALCKSHRIEVAGVTKVTRGSPEIAKAMLRGGVTAIADSRLKNIQRLQAAEIDTVFMLLTLPALSAVKQVVDIADISVNSEMAALQALSAAALAAGKRHDVLLMVDLGDLREGIWPDGLMPLVKQTLELPGIAIKGLGCNLACLGGVIPTETNMNRLVELAVEIERCCDLRLQWVSGINSSGLELIAAGRMPQRVNHARIGEAILLGRETTSRKPWPGTYQDAFHLQAEVLELKPKPSLPIGARGEDAFGQHPHFEDRGVRCRALLNIGREDVDVDGIKPDDPNVSILGASSGYLVLDVTNAEVPITLGSMISFTLNYSALLAAMHSDYVCKCFIDSVLPTAGE